MQNNVSTYEGVICEDDVFSGAINGFTNVINPRSAISRKEEYKKTLIKKGASIGANATIICSNTIGEHAFIGASSVVTKNVLSYSIVAGNPPRHVRWMSEHGKKLNFDKNNIAVCVESGLEYKLINNSVMRIK